MPSPSFGSSFGTSVDHEVRQRVRRDLELEIGVLARQMRMMQARMKMLQKDLEELEAEE
jgi:chaperonin cofactor prefoldin